MKDAIHKKLVTAKPYLIEIHPIPTLFFRINYRKIVPYVPEVIK